MSVDSKSRTTLIFLFFFSSGFAALLYQIVWLKYLNLLFGSTTFATAAVLSAFMFGLSLGSWLASKFPKLYSSSLRSYGLIEMGVGVFAVLFPHIYSSLKIPFSVVFNIAGPESFWYNVAAFAIAFLVLAIPTALMGATLPLLGHSLVKQDQPVSAPIGLLYGINTAGAVAGIICSAFLLIPYLGLNATIYVGVIINCTVGLICFLLGSSARNPIPEKGESGRSQRYLLWLYTFSGFLAIAYEVFWTRILVLHLGSSVYAYAIMLAVFLLGISIGSYLSGKLLQHTQRPLTSIFGWIQIAWAFSILIQIIQFTKLSDTLFFLASRFDRLDITTHFIVLFLGSLQVLLLPTILSGALFPTVVKHLWNAGIPIQRTISLAYSYNTVGGILGSLAAGFLLIPAIGTQDSLIVAAALNLVLGVISLSKTKGTKLRLVQILSVLIFVSAAFLISKSFQVLQSAGIFQMEGSEELIHLEEDIAATVTVEQRSYMNLNYRSLSINGVNVAGSSPSLVAIQKMQGNLPMALFGPIKNKHVLHIGFGSGGTAYAVSLYPNTKITVVELSRSVVRNADQYFRSENHGVVHSSNTEFIY
ncbi:MAG TPA: fused MFS/spermidine synthase, partial [Acidobacteriota bacterium]|nr:fused MFS/spermidine synthase [Acidobacteriota bacterium]